MRRTIKTFVMPRPGAEAIEKLNLKKDMIIYYIINTVGVKAINYFQSIVCSVKSA